MRRVYGGGLIVGVPVIVSGAILKYAFRSARPAVACSQRVMLPRLASRRSE